MTTFAMSRLAGKIRVLQARTAFSLIELMMVALILALLMSILVAGVMSARVKAREAQVILEINNMHGGILSFKDRFGAGVAPPSSGGDATVTYLRQCWPRYYKYDVASVNQDLTTNYPGRGLALANMDAAEALVFWLGGLQDPTTTGTTQRGLIGFAQAADQPLANKSTCPARHPAFFDFKPDRLVDYDNDGWYEYIPAISGVTPPYVYFDGNAINANASFSRSGTNWGTAVAYQLDRGGPANAGTWQIISAGIDNNYGLAATVLRRVPSLTGFSNANGTGPSPVKDDEDNLTNIFDRNLGAARQ